MPNIEHVPAVVAALGSFAALFSSLLNRRKIQEVHLSVNSRLDELLRQKGIASYAEGHQAGIESQQKKENQ